MITQFKIYEEYYPEYEHYPEYEVGDINCQLESIIIDKSIQENKTTYYRTINMIFIETDYITPDEVKNYKSIEEAYEFDNNFVGKMYKILYENWKNFDMTTANEVKNVIDIWVKKIPDLKIFNEIDKYNL